jgi:hypothetical protein
MTEMQRALKMLNELKGCHLIDGPSGRWHFVGRVPAHLALVRKDGRAATQDDYEKARRFGPALAGMTTRTWASKEDALAALAAPGA